jgi:hypothetical protein
MRLFLRTQIASRTVYKRFYNTGLLKRTTILPNKVGIQLAKEEHQAKGFGTTLSLYYSS